MKTLSLLIDEQKQATSHFNANASKQKFRENDTPMKQLVRMFRNC